MNDTGPTEPQYPLDVQTLCSWTADWVVAASCLLQVDPVDVIAVAPEFDTVRLTEAVAIWLAARRVCFWRSVDPADLLAMLRDRYGVDDGAVR